MIEDTFKIINQQIVLTSLDEDGRIGVGCSQTGDVGYGVSCGEGLGGCGRFGAGHGKVGVVLGELELILNWQNPVIAIGQFWSQYVIS